MAINLKRSLLWGAAFGLGTVGAVTLAPAGLTLGLLGAFGVCNAGGLATAGVGSAIGAILGAIGKVDEHPAIAADLDDLQRQQKNDHDVLGDLARGNNDLRQKADRQEARNADLVRLTQVLVSAARADGPVNPTEASCIRNKVFEASYLLETEEMQDRLRRALTDGTSLKAASRLFDEITSDPLRRLVRAMIEAVMASDAGDGPLARDEQEHLAAWDRLAVDDVPAAA